MKQSTIENHINPNPDYNCTLTEANELANLCSKWGIHNLLFRFRPPIIEYIHLLPVDKELVPDEKFTDDMFEKGGLFEYTPMNAHLEIAHNKLKAPVWINAGYLKYYFDKNTYLGYSILKQIIKYYKYHML